MTNRRTPAKRPTKSTTWKPSRPRAELYKAIGGAAGVVLVTVLLIFIMKPGDSSSSPATIPNTSVTQPTDSTTPATTPAASTPAASTPAASTPAQP